MMVKFTFRLKLNVLFVVILGINLVITPSLHSSELKDETQMNSKVSQLVNAFKEVEQKGLSYSSNKTDRTYWGAYKTLGASIINQLGDLGDRSALPFLEELALLTNSYSFVRERAASAYIRVATPDESISFLQVLLAQDESSATGWRFSFLMNFLRIFDEAISSKQLAAKSQINLFNVLLEFIHSSGRSSDVRIVDKFLTKHCQQYETSKQRLFMSKKFVDDENQKVVAHYSSIQESIACVPPAEQHDLREQFPDLPPLPDEPAQKTNCQVYLMIVSLILVIICLTLGIRFYRKERPQQ